MLNYKMTDKRDLNDIERIVYIWARYEGIRDSTPEGKSYDKGDVNNLIRRLQRYNETPNSFDEGFEEDKP